MWRSQIEINPIHLNLQMTSPTCKLRWSTTFDNFFVGLPRKITLHNGSHTIPLKPIHRDPSKSLKLDISFLIYEKKKKTTKNSSLIWIWVVATFSLYSHCCCFLFCFFFPCCCCTCIVVVVLYLWFTDYSVVNRLLVHVKVSNLLHWQVGHPFASSTLPNGQYTRHTGPQTTPLLERTCATPVVLGGPKKKMWVLSNLITAHIIKRVLLCTLDIIHECIIDHWFNLILHACLGLQCNSMDWENISLTASTNWASILIQYITKWTENGTHHSAIFLNSSCKKKQTNKQWIGPCPWELCVPC